jgi:hypothetical protein
MSTAETKPAGIGLQVLADLDAVVKRFIDGSPVDPETSRRIEERADRIKRKSAAPEALWTMIGSRRCFTTMTTYEVRS